MRRSHDAALLRRVLQVLQCGLSFALQMTHVHVLDVGQLTQDGLLLLLFLVVFGDHLGQFSGELDIVSRRLDLSLVQLILKYR